MMSSLLLQQGQSGSSLCIEKSDIGYCVVKKSDSGNRLLRQRLKQEQYYDLINKYELRFLFQVPCVVGESIPACDKGYWFSMEYVNGIDILGLLGCGTVSRLDRILQSLFLLLDWEFESSTLVKFPLKVFFDKIDMVGGAFDADADLDIVWYKLRCLARSFKGCMVPCGLCHGDLTFNNMVFSERIVLLDMLDVFFESPLQDVGKLLQEVDLQWSLCMSNACGTDVDMAKVQLGYCYLQKRIYEYAFNLDVSPSLVLLFRVLTLFRILPYCKSHEMYRFILSKCKELLS